MRIVSYLLGVSLLLINIVKAELPRGLSKVNRSLVTIKLGRKHLGKAVLINAEKGIFLIHSTVLPKNHTTFSAYFSKTPRKKQKLKLVLKKIDPITHLACLKAKEWSSIKVHSIKLLKKGEVDLGDTLYVTSNHGFEQGICNYKKLPGLLHSMRYVSVFELKMKKINAKVGGSFVFNKCGELAGIVTAAARRKPPQNFRIRKSYLAAYALNPVVINRVIKGFLSMHGSPIHPTIGAYFRETSEPGVAIEMITQGSTSAKAGLKKNDVVLAVNKKEIIHSIDLAAYIFDQPIRSVLKFKIKRNGKIKYINVIVGGQ